jgi:hypothetical protein
LIEEDFPTMLKDDDLQDFFTYVGSTPIYFFDDPKKDTSKYYPPSLFLDYIPTMLSMNTPNLEPTLYSS